MVRFSVLSMLALLGLVFFSCDEESSSNKSYPTLEEYLEINNITEYEETSSGLIYIIERDGTGDLPVAGQTIAVHYTGYHLDDTKFDSSYDINEAISFVLGQGSVIKGWDEGLLHFNKGSVGTLYIPHELAYGTTGSASGTIAPREDLKFDINVVAID